MDEPHRFFFVHVMKTGGTDLFARLGGDPTIERDEPPSFTEAEIYPNSSDRAAFDSPQLYVRRLLQRWEVRRDEIRLIMGHFPLCTVQLLDADFTTLTVLRDPVERTLSHLRHHRRMHAEDRDRTLEDLYDDDFRYERLIHNHMVKMFGLTADEMTGGLMTDISLTPAHLDRAKSALQTVDLLGVQEQFDEFCRMLEAQLGWNLGTTFRANQTRRVDVSDAFRHRIADDNALDRELYEHACGIVSDRAG